MSPLLEKETPVFAASAVPEEPRVMGLVPRRLTGLSARRATGDPAFQRYLDLAGLRLVRDELLEVTRDAQSHVRTGHHVHSDAEQVAGEPGKRGAVLPDHRSGAGGEQRLVRSEEHTSELQ